MKDLVISIRGLRKSYSGSSEVLKGKRVMLKYLEKRAGFKNISIC